ncbi:hypothetical protein NFI96_021659 [Prochilodus magdalenae]|nr:hypothetical protein NFI96_021659 [Prochilodus magdalenae]
MPSVRTLRLFSLWFVITVADKSLGEMFTSMMSVKQAILSERQLIGYLKTYIDHETQRLEDIKRFYSKVSAFHNGIHNKLTTALANPLVAFTLIKRLQSEWPNLVYSNEAEENLQALRVSYSQMESRLPKLEDLQGAAHGLMRLQDVYALQVEGLVRGHFQKISNGNTVDIYKPPVSTPLSGDDCFLVGKVAYGVEDYYHSVQWLEEAVRLFRGVNWSPEHEGTLEDALDHLAFSHFKTGNISSALSLSLELLRHDPSNKRVLHNVERYEKLLVESPPMSPGPVLKRPSTTYLRTRNTYERLCQTRGSQPKLYENPSLFCDYFTNGSPGLFLQPMKRELVSLQPYVVLFHDFVTAVEAQSIRDCAMPGLRRSVVASGVNQTTVDYRISKRKTFLSVQYERLSSVEAGGSTAFIYANFSVPVVENSALFWWNLHRNGQGNGDTLHAGCPVLIGDKWVANKWVHEYGQEFQRRCSPDPEE